MQPCSEILKKEELKRCSAIFSGYAGLDNGIKLLYKGGLSLVVGRPAMGKSMFALNIAARLINAGNKVCYISFEASKEHILEKLLLTKQLCGSQLEKFYVCDIPYTPLRIREMTEMIKSECPDASLIVIDYIQLIGIENIQWLYKAFPESAVLILSKASRKVEERDNHHISLGDIDSIESLSQYLDTIVSIYRDDYYMLNDEPTNIMQVVNLRNRQCVILKKDGYSLFEDN